MYLFLPGSRGAGKSHLVKVIYHSISETLLYHCFKDAENLRPFSSGRTGISELNIGGTTIPSELSLEQIYLI